MQNLVEDFHLWRGGGWLELTENELLNIFRSILTIIFQHDDHCTHAQMCTFTICSNHKC